MQTNEIASKENQSSRIQEYMLGKSIDPLYDSTSPINCGVSGGLYAHEIHNKTHVDTESSLIRGEISQGIIITPSYEINKPVTDATPSKNFSGDIGACTRVRRPDNVLSGITIDRFDPLSEDQIKMATRDQPRIQNFGMDTRNEAKYA